MAGLLIYGVFLPQDRAKIFSALVSQDRNTIWPEARLAGRIARNSLVTINRKQLLYDGFNHLNDLGDELKLRIRIQFIDEHGLVEAGVDGGGLFKDFMEELAGIGFDPQYGLFTCTEDNQIYPNPAAPHMQADALSLLEFMGRMLGACICSFTLNCLELLSSSTPVLQCNLKPMHQGTSPVNCPLFGDLP